MVMCPSKGAEKIGREILENRLAACVNVTQQFKSTYWWKGRMETAKERLLIIKTKSSLFNSLKRLVRSVHPYKVPEIIALPISKGYKPYLDWISEETKKPRLDQRSIVSTRQKRLS
jgi:periplasmic divalent cation tolerance protein